MIVNKIIFIAYTVLSWIIGLFPDSVGFPEEAHTAMTSLGGYLGIWSPILPIDTLLTVVTLTLSVEIGIFGFKTLKWIISHLPWVGGRG